MSRTPSALIWPYPLSSPSARFSYYNDYVRQFDVRWAELAPATQALWDDLVEVYPWLSRCIPWIYDFDPLTPNPGSALTAYRAVNAARLSDGLAASDVPPAVNTVPDGDTITIVTGSSAAWTWAGRSNAPGGTYVSDVRWMPLNHEAESGPALQKFRWLSTQAVAYDTPQDLVALLASIPGGDMMKWIALAIAIRDAGSAPFFGARVSFSPGAIG